MSQSKSSELDSLIYCLQLVNPVIKVLYGIKLIKIVCDNDFNAIASRHNVHIGRHQERNQPALTLFIIFPIGPRHFPYEDFFVRNCVGKETNDTTMPDYK